jgi:hypothetical protein
MREILKDGLEVFIVIMIIIMGIGGALVTSGKLDFWGSRLLNEKRRALAQGKPIATTKFPGTNS